MKHIMLLVSALLSIAIAENTYAQRLSTFEVTVTNSTNNITFTPIFAVTHNLSATPLFKVGQPASIELEDLAEGGSPAALEAAYLSLIHI